MSKSSTMIRTFVVTVTLILASSAFAGDNISDAFEDTFGHDKISNAFDYTFGHNKIPNAFNSAFGGGSSRHKAKKAQPQNTQTAQ